MYPTEILRLRLFVMQQKMTDTLSYPSSQKCILMVTCHSYIPLEHQPAVKVAITLLFFISILLIPQGHLLFELPAEKNRSPN